MLLSRVWTIDPVMMQAEHELIAILPHFQIRENSGVLNFIGVRISWNASSAVDVCALLHVS